MISENIKSTKDYSGINANFKKAMDFLKKKDLNSLKVGNYEIDGENVFAFVQEYKTEQEEERRWEAHRKYIDIQCIIKGKEVIYYTPVENLVMIKDNLAEKDVAFYKNVEHSSKIELTNGEYAIFFPEDGHKPCCILDNSSKVKKIVIKVACI